MNDFIEQLNARVLVQDSDHAPCLRRHGVDVETITMGVEASVAPTIVEAMHKQELIAGVDIITTATLGNITENLRFHSLDAETICENAVRVARSAIDSSGASRRIFLAGAIGGALNWPDTTNPLDTIQARIQPVAQGLLCAGIDVLLIDNAISSDQLSAILGACRRAMSATGTRVPLWVKVTVRPPDRHLSGSLLARQALEMGADFVGATRGYGSAVYVNWLDGLAAVAGRVSVSPNAAENYPYDYDYLPVDEPVPFAAQILGLGGRVRVVGGSFRSTASHSRAFAAAIRDN